MAENLQSTPPTDPSTATSPLSDNDISDSRESQRFHLSWSLPSIVAVFGAAVLVWASLEMTASIIIVSLLWLLSVALCWLATPASIHIAFKAFVTGVLTICAAGAIWWIAKFDRPILNPEISGIVAQQGTNDFVLDAEILVTNTGRQNTFSKKWGLKVDIDGTTLSGEPKFGQKRPEGADDEPELYAQDFPIGKPVRGWVYFAFRGVTGTKMREILRCNTPPSNAKITFSLTDTKEERDWHQTRSIAEMIREQCRSTLDQPAPVIPQNSTPHLQPKPPEQHPKTQNPAENPSAVPATVSNPQPPVVNNVAPNGIANSGTMFNPQVNNYRNPVPEIEVSQSFPIPAQTRPTATAPTQPGYSRLPSVDPSAYRPGASVRIVLKGVFYNPSFIANCSVPCTLDKAWKIFGGGEMSSISTDYESLGNRSGTIAGVAYHISQMYPGTVIQLDFKSLDDRPLTVTNVRAYAP